MPYQTNEQLAGSSIGLRTITKQSLAHAIKLREHDGYTWDEIIKELTLLYRKEYPI